MTSDVVAGIFVCLSFVNWIALRGRPEWMRLVGGAVLLAPLTVAITFLVGSPIRPDFGLGSAPEAVWRHALVVVWWLLAARSVAQAIQVALLTRPFGGEGRLFADLLAALVYLTAVLAIIDTVFGLPIGALVATSGVVAIVLGLALQSTLSDVFSGIAIGIEHPYSVGDRVWIEGPIEGTVVRINWRAVHIRTDSNDIATIPHSLAAKSRLINRSFPTAQRNDAVHFSCPVSLGPEDVAELIRRAVLLCPKILSNPEPAVALVRIGRRRNDYEVGFAVARSDDLWESKSALLKEVLRQVQGAMSETNGHGLTEREATAGDPHALARIALFRMLSAEQMVGLGQKARSRFLQPGEVLFSEGEAEGSLYVIRSGVMEVSRVVGGRPAMVGRVAIGDYIGEIGLLTGAPHSATVTAITECFVLELKKEHLAPLLAEDPPLLHALEASARRGQALVDRSVAASVGSQTIPPGQLLTRIRHYFLGIHKG